jgi:hypothetical protein
MNLIMMLVVSCFIKLFIKKGDTASRPDSLKTSTFIIILNDFFA